MDSHFFELEVDKNVSSFDSVQDGSVAVFSPHKGFEDPTTPEDAPLRESIELREVGVLWLSLLSIKQRARFCKKRREGK